MDVLETQDELVIMMALPCVHVDEVEIVGHNDSLAIAGHNSTTVQAPRGTV